MKKLLQLSVLLLTTISFGQTPIYQFKFDGNSNLSIGGAGAITFFDDATPSAIENANDRSNVATSALRMFKKKGTITLTNLPQGNAARTVSFWMLDNSDASNGNSIAPFSYGNIGSGNAQNFAFIIRRDSGQMNISGGTNVPLQVYPFGIPPANVWNHYVVTYDGTNASLYINGYLYSSTDTMALNTVGTTFRIGMQSENFARTSNVVMDDLNIFSTALTQAQVTALFKSNLNQTPLQSGIPTTGLVYANHFTNGNFSDSSSTGAVFTSFIGTSSTAPDKNGIANNARALNTGGIMIVEITDYPELRVGTNTTNYEFTVSAQVKVDAAYFAALGTSQYITFFNQGGIYLRLLKLAGGTVLQGGYETQSGTYVATSSIAVPETDFVNNFLTATLTSATGLNNMNLYANTFTTVGTTTLGVNYNAIPKLSIGYPDLSNQSFKGIIDNVFVYDRKLSGNEVQTIIDNNNLSNQNFNNNNLTFSMYPNPAIDILNIEMEKEIQSVEIYSLLGQKVLDSANKEINISNLSSGMYMVRAQDIDGAVATQKLVKK